MAKALITGRAESCRSAKRVEKLLIFHPEVGVYPHDKSVQMARQDGRKNYSIAIAKLADSIVVREETDIDKIAEVIVKRIEQAMIICRRQHRRRYGILVKE